MVYTNRWTVDPQRLPIPLGGCAQDFPRAEKCFPFAGALRGYVKKPMNYKVILMHEGGEENWLAYRETQLQQLANSAVLSLIKVMLKHTLFVFIGRLFDG